MYSGNDFKGMFRTLGFLIILLGMGAFGLGFCVAAMVFN